MVGRIVGLALLLAALGIAACSSGGPNATGVQTPQVGAPGSDRSVGRGIRQPAVA